MGSAGEPSALAQSKEDAQPRDVRHEGTTTVSVREVVRGVAPVALRCHDRTFGPDGREERVVELRWWNDRLWKPFWPAVGAGRVTEADPSLVRWHLVNAARNRGYDSEHAAVVGVQKKADGLVLIGGVVHEPATEPIYEVVTSRGADYATVWLSPADGIKRWSTDWGGTGARDWFSVNEFEAALDAARSLRKEGFDTSDLPTEPPIEVLIERAVRRHPRTEVAAQRRREAAEWAAKALSGALRTLAEVPRRTWRGPGGGPSTCWRHRWPACGASSKRWQATSAGSLRARCTLPSGPCGPTGELARRSTRDEWRNSRRWHTTRSTGPFSRSRC